MDAVMSKLSNLNIRYRKFEFMGFSTPFVINSGTKMLISYVYPYMK